LTTTLFGIDSNTDSLVRIGGLDGVPSPNTGQLTTIGPLGVNATSFGGFDIVPGTNQGYAVLRVAGVSVLHRIDLVTGAATAIGPIGVGTTIDGIAAFDVNAPGTTVSYTGLAVPIPDNNPTGVNIPLTVSGVGTIRDLNVRFDNGGACDATVGLTNAAINHTFVGDLRIRLTSPSGVTRTIFNRRGGTRENICRTDVNDNFVFSPFSVLTSVTGQPVAHNFSPEQPLTAFRGQNADGTWTLNVSDNAGLDTGSLRRFSLIFNALDAALEKTPHDFDGDGRTDIAISRNNAGVREWWVQRSSNNTVFAAAFGAGGDQITPADYTGDGLADIAQWRPATGEWFVLRSENLTFYAVPFGNQSFGDIPAPGDFDGDGKADVTVYRPGAGTWFVLQSSNNLTLFIPFGNANDLPVTGDYDGDGKADAAVYRTNGANKEWWIRRSSNGTNFATQFGVTGDRAVPGDYTGDGKTDVALWRPSTGQWFILRSEDFSFYAFPFGTTGDVPAPGDFDGDGRFDAGIFRPTGATWFIQRSSDNGTTIQGFGLSTDQPIPNAYVR
jgi:subtilisin-like proprotein convertase family protein